MQFGCPLFQARSLTSFIRVVGVLAMASGAMAFGGSSLSVRRDLATIVSMAPAPVLVKKGHELRTAEAAAAQVAGAQAFVGAGDSMEPIYATGTAIVVTPIDFAQLRQGMSVVYVNQDGRGVAHVLIKKTRNGWVAQGVNNPEQDTDRVTVLNLVGVVTQAYAASDTTVRREIAARAGVNGTKAQVALNLSKAGSSSMVLAWQ